MEIIKSIAYPKIEHYYNIQTSEQLRMYLAKMKRLLITAILVLTLALPGWAELLMRTHGNVTLSTCVHGFDKQNQTYPGYRSDFTLFVDFYRWRSLVFNSSIGNTTVIEKPKAEMQLDRIRYTLTPGLRLEFHSWLLNGSLLHECIHNIGRPEDDGSTWWNSFRIGVGTKEAYFLYLLDEYKNLNNVFLNKFDAQVNVGQIIEARRTLLSGQNHNYRQEYFSLLRYHIGIYRNWVGFVTFRQHLWILRDDTSEQKLSISLNIFRKGVKKFAGFYYDYNITDTFSLDSAEGIGTLGLRIVI
ncbi:hypothetical protein K9N50_03330 [bacterium]|nr:hypothetical protein [bacterium]